MHEPVSIKQHIYGSNTVILINKMLGFKLEIKLFYTLPHDEIAFVSFLTISHRT